MKHTTISVTWRHLLSGTLLLFVLAPASAQQPVRDIGQRFTATEVMIAMRDGIRLNTAVYVPRDRKGPLPFVLLRTPYGIAARAARGFGDYLKDMVEDGYIFVFQDIRGRYKSEG